VKQRLPFISLIRFYVHLIWNVNVLRLWVVPASKDVLFNMHFIICIILIGVIFVVVAVVGVAVVVTKFVLFHHSFRIDYLFLI